MKFIYMDESGKQFLNDSFRNRFLFGALIIDRKNVPPALKAFKESFSKLKDKVKQGIREDSKNTGLSDNMSSDRSTRIIDKFEIHSNEVFNPHQDKKRGTATIENPWKFIKEDEALELLSELLLKIHPFIESIYMFEIERASYKSFFSPPKHKLPVAQNELIKYIVEDFHHLSQEQSTYITIVTDTIDSKSRDLFIDEIFSNNYDNLWVEAILVESYKNAFIQLIDLITYLYYLDYSGQLDKEQPSKPFKRFKKHYKEHYLNKMVIKDLITHLQNNPTFKADDIPTEVAATLTHVDTEIKI